MQRLLMLALGIGLTGLLLVLVISPFWHPNARLLVLTADNYSLLDAPPLAYVAEDATSLTPLDKVLYQRDGKPQRVRVDALGTPTDMQKLGAAIRNTPAGLRDVLMVYVSAHGVSDDGTAYLLCENYHPRTAAVSQYRVADLLEQLQSAPSSVKLLILDTGAIDYDPRLGMIVNEFPSLLRSAVEATADRRLWVLHSHGVLERSHVSPSLKQGLFSHFVAQGLAGAADMNRNSEIDLGELDRYVTANVSTWVRNASGGASSQTPELLWGGGALASATNLPVLLPLPPPEKPESASQEPAKPADKGAAPAEKSPPAANSPAAGNSTTAATGGPSMHYASLFPGTVTLRNLSVFAWQMPTTAGPPAGATSPATPAAPPATSTTSNSPAPGPSAANNSAPPSASSAPAASAPGAQPASPTTPGGDAGSSPAPATPAGGDPNGQAAPAAGTDAAAPAPAAAPAAKRPKPLSPHEEAEKLLNEAWEMRDSMLQGDLASGAVLVEAPQLWRELQGRMLRYDERLHRGSAYDPALIASAVRDEILSLNPSPDAKHVVTPIGIAAQIIAARPQVRLDNAVLHSLGLAELLMNDQVIPRAPPLVDAMEAFDTAVAARDLATLRKWRAGLKPDQLRFVEIRLACRLLDEGFDDIGLLHLVLTTRRAVERVAAMLGGENAWAQPMMRQIDQRRRAADRLLLDQPGSDHASEAQQLLAEVRQQCQTLEQNLADLKAARRLAVTMVVRTNYYLRWHARSGALPDPRVPDARVLQTLLLELRELIALLVAPTSEHAPAVRRLATSVQRRNQQILDNFAPETIDPSINSLAVAPWVTAALETPLPWAEGRKRLRELWISGDRRFADRWIPADVPISLPRPHQSGSEDWQRLDRLAELELMLVQVTPPLDDDQRHQVDLLIERRQRLAKALAENERDPSPSSDRALWLEHRAFGEILRRFYRDLPQRVESSIVAARNSLATTSEADRVTQILTALASLALVDARDAQFAGGGAAVELLATDSVHSLLVWQRQRRIAGLADAPVSEVTFLRQAIADDRQAANAIPGYPLIHPIAPALVDTTGPTSISLATISEQDISLQISHRGTQPGLAWIVLEYDSKLIAVETLDEEPVYHHPLLIQMVAAPVSRGPAPSPGAPASPSPSPSPAPSQPATINPILGQQTVEYPWRPDFATAPATFRMAAGGQATLRLRVVRRGQSALPARLIVRTLLGSDDVRHRTDVELPAPETIDLVVSGTPGTWQATDSGSTLFLFPNRTTNYQLAVANRTAQARSVDVELFTPENWTGAALPDAMLSPADAAGLLANCGKLTPLASAKGVALPASAASVSIPLAKPAAAAAPSSRAGANGPAPAAADAGGKAPSGGAAKTPPISVDQGILAVITDTNTGRQVIKLLDLTLQRPRRYVRCAVNYDGEKKQVSIRVTAPDQLIVPPGGANVVAEILPPLPNGTPAVLTGVVGAPDFAANLHASVPPGQDKEIRLRISVDNYPRAFLYRLRCQGMVTNLPEDLDGVAVRVTSPLENTAYKAPSAPIPAHMEVDVPGGTFNPLNDLIEIGIDRQRNRELQGDNPLQFHTDRQVTLSLDHVNAQGQLGLAAVAKDFDVELPVTGLSNLRVNVLARILRGSQTNWSRPIEIMLDGDPPSMQDVRMEPGRIVTAGDPLIVSVLTDAHDLSPTSGVKMGIDTTGSGKFGEKPAPVPAQLQPSGRWQATVDTAGTAPGKYHLLLQATDAVGNVSDYLPVSMQIVSKLEAAHLLAARTNQVAGTILYNGTGIAAAEVTLTALPPEKGDPDISPLPLPTVAPVTADDRGNFTFPAVPPGRYKLTTSGLARNLVRKAEETLVVSPAPASVPTLRISAK